MATFSREKLQSTARQEAWWVVDACRQFFADRCPSLAASIAFYSAFSLAPTLVMVIAVSGWFFGDAAARGELFHEVHSVLGNDAAASITTIVQNAHRAGSQGGIAAVISIAMLIIGASATFSSLHSALNAVWPPTGPRASTVLALVRVRLVSFGLVLGVAFLLITSLVLDTAITFVGQWIWGNSRYFIIGNLLQLGVGLLVLAVAFAGLLKFLPDAQVRWRDAMVGGIVAAVLFSGGRKLFALYLAHAGLASAFGAAGSLAVLLMWLYFSAAVLLLGAAFAAARGRLADPRGAWDFRNETPPGSRAKIASLLAASTIAANASRNSNAAVASTPNPAGAADATDDPAPTPPSPDGHSTSDPHAHTAGGLPEMRAKPAFRIGEKLARVEGRASHAAAVTLVSAGRKAVAADHYVKRHPWGSVLFAAGAALAVTAAANHRQNAADEAQRAPRSDPGDEDGKATG